VIRIVFNYRVASGTEVPFAEAWERFKTKMLAYAPGALDASLFRDENDSTSFVGVTCWSSLEDWKAYWSTGVPDPEGELAINRVLVEVKALAREEART
jgi:heme-degrading monooxygenase HmoA